MSPLDVVLDKELALVVQPDAFFVSNERSTIIRDHVWGAPDLVVEVASPTTQYRDETLKLAWYRKYGVRECWLVSPRDQRVDVVDCANGERRNFTGTATIRSSILPDLAVPANECFV